MEIGLVTISRDTLEKIHMYLRCFCTEADGRGWAGGQAGKKLREHTVKIDHHGVFCFVVSLYFFKVFWLVCIPGRLEYIHLIPTSRCPH